MEIPDISKWFINLKKSNRISIEEIEEIFKTLNGKTDDSEWIINYKESIKIDIRKIFLKCGPLNENAIDMLNWHIKFQKEFNREISTIRIRGIFYNCSSIELLPDISNWNINNVDDLSYVFYGCSSLKSLPDISKWNTENVIYVFSEFFFWY